MKTNNNKSKPSRKKPIITAFKNIALFQAKNVSEDEAKCIYFDLIKNYFLYALLMLKELLIEKMTPYVDLNSCLSQLLKEVKD